MKLLSLLLVVLLFTYDDDSTDTPVSKEPTNIVVEMKPTASSMVDISGAYIFQVNKEYNVREDGKCKILLIKNTYRDREGKEKDILSYGIFDIAKKEYIYYTEGTDVAKRLERDRELCDGIDNPADTSK